MDNFQKFKTAFKIWGIYIDDGTVGRIGQAFIMAEYFFSMVLMVYVHVISLLLGGVWRGKDFETRENLIVWCSTVTGTAVAMKHNMLFRYRKKLAFIVDELKGFRPSTSTGKYTRMFTYVYEGMGIYFNLSFMAMIVIQSPDLSLPYPVYVPIVTDTQWKRSMVFTIFQIGVFYVWGMMVLTDTFLLHSTNQLCDRFRTLDHTLRLVGLTDDEKKAEISNDDVLKLESYKDEDLVQSCLKEHLLLLKVRDILGDMLNETFVYQTANSMTILMAVFYIFSSSKDLVNDVAGFLGVAVVDMVQVLTTCLSGELLKLKSEAMHFACYNSRWYNSNPKIKTSLLIMSTYASREVDLKGAYVFNLSLSTYETFVRQSFSIFTVMYQFL